MTNPFAIVRTSIDVDENVLGESIWLWCPGCATWGHGLHQLPVSGSEQPQWSWNGDLVSVTLEPSILAKSTSILAKSTWGEQQKNRTCHSFLRDGIWDFLNDSTHTLSGQKVPMAPLPDWVVD